MVDSMTARCPDAVAAKQAKRWNEVFVLINAVWFLPNVVLCIMAK